jgi:hypothetical protein
MVTPASRRRWSRFVAGPPSLTTGALATPLACCVGSAVGFPSRTSCGTLGLRPRSKRARCALYEQRRWGDPQPRQQEPSSARRITCGAVVGRPEGAGAYRTSGAASLVGSASPAVVAPAGSGIRLSCPGPVARVPAAALPVEGRRSACLAAGSTRRPRKRAHARSGRRNTSPGWCPPARSQRTPFTDSALRLRLPRVRRRTHHQPPGRDRGSATTAAGLARSVVGWESLQLTRAGASRRWVLPRHRRSTGCYRAGGLPLPVVAALGGTSSTQTLASRAGTTMAFRSGRRG